MFLTYFIVDRSLIIIITLPPFQTDHPSRFIAENAQRFLLNLTSLGVRVGGSEANDEEAKNMLRYLLEEIQGEMLHDTHSLEVQTQVSGETNFQLEFQPYGMTTVFKGCVNVMAKLTPKTVHTEYSGKCLLLNSHFDTMPGMLHVVAPNKSHLSAFFLLGRHGGRE